MSKITINAVLTLLKLAIAIVSKAVRVIYAVCDLVDDGCLNASVEKPAWMLTLSNVLESLQDIGLTLSRVESDAAYPADSQQTT